MITPDSGGFLFDRRGRSADLLRDQWAGAACFLCCGGPSLNALPLGQLQQRGLLVAAVNQCGATHVRPHLHFSVDQCGRFHQALWDDAAVMKFVRHDRAQNRTSRRGEHGWTLSGPPANQHANTWFFKHARQTLPLEHLAGTLLTQERVAWKFQGRLHGKRRHTKSVMLPALRLLYWLGVRRVYLLGCDFEMSPDATYAFHEPKDQRASQYNSRSYQMLDEFFAACRPHFAAHGFAVYNATPGGNLTAFERLDYSQAVADCRIETPRDVRGLYRVG